jgi:hypothetical protein
MEGPARGQPIPVDSDFVTAFVGPAPRGPVDHAVPIGSPEQFLKVFGVPDFHCRMEFAIRQFFTNGGRQAVVVRVSGTNARNRIHLPAESENLILEACNPGPLEHLRASIDYDGVATDEPQLFNLIVQRLRGAGSAWIDAQEYYRRVSIDPASRDYIGYVLEQSELVRLVGEAPAVRPDPTYKPCTVRQAGYVETRISRGASPPPSDYDLVGSASQGTGLNALDQIPDIGQIILLSGSEGRALGPIALLAADKYCRSHQAMLIIDPPARWQTVNDVLRDQQRSDFSSPNTITWFPGVAVRSKQGEKVMTTAAGAVAAALVASDRQDGVLHIHAEDPVMLRGGARPTTVLDDDDIHRLTRVGVNALVQKSALHLQLYGNVTEARYGSMSGNWNEMQIRRQVLFLLRRIRTGTRWTFFNESSEDVWKEVSEQIGVFLSELHARSILAGESARESYFVKCDRDTNAGLEGRIGEIAFIVGFAIRRPGEFLAFRFQRSGGVCRIKELGWQSRLELAV